MKPGDSAGSHLGAPGLATSRSAPSGVDTSGHAARGPQAGVGLVSEPVLTTGGKDEQLEELLSAGLDAHNLAASGVPVQHEFTVKAEDASGLVAGLSGWTWGPVAGLAMVWVREDSRRAGWGGRLLAAAEHEARARGCDRVFVSSFTFQAPEFYARHGYTEVARVEEYPVDGAADVHLVKRLLSP